MMVNNYNWLMVEPPIEPPTPLKNDGLRKCWDDDIPNMMGKS